MGAYGSPELTSAKTENNKNIIFCVACGCQYNKREKRCPNCGKRRSKPFYLKGWFWVLMIVVALAAFGMSDDTTVETSKNVESSSVENDSAEKNETGDITENNEVKTTKPKNNNEDTIKQKMNTPLISKEEFEALKNGMTYEEVVAIIGGEGELISQSDIAGYTTKLYMWEGYGALGANANAMFQNNLLISKSQIGLN